MRAVEGLAVGASILAIGGGVISIIHGNHLEKAYNQQCPQLALEDAQCSAENGNIEGYKEGGAIEILGGVGLLGLVLIVSGNGDGERPKVQSDSESLPPAQS